MDQIRIDNLEIYAFHGVFPVEKEKGQRFYINAVLYTDLTGAGETDDLTFSTHYGEVCQCMTRVMKMKSWDLIERAAQVTAEEVLLQFPLVQEIELELRKPEAPIGLPFDSVSVKVKRGWHKVYLALGSNLGEKETYIRNAVAALQARREFKDFRCSDLIVTAAYGGVEQDEFLNGVLECKTLFSPYRLLEVLQEIEKQAGRERKIHWGPRTLDLDILFYDDGVYDSKELTIPHRDMANRDFVLQPMLQLAPYKRHPLTHKTIEEMWRELHSRN